MGKKLTHGEGWRVIPAEPELQKAEIVSKAPEQQRIKISLEKRKKGKVVTLLSKLILNDSDLKNLSKNLKNYCGTGGTVSESNIELQGDCREKAKIWLQENNWGIQK